MTGSGNPLAALDPSAGAQVTPRLIGRNQLHRRLERHRRHQPRLARGHVQPMGSLNVNFDYAAYLRNMEVLMSITGVMPNGVMADADVLEADVKRTMLEQAEQSLLLLDESKLSARGRQAIAPVRSVSLVLAPGEAAMRLGELGATVRAVLS